MGNHQARLEKTIASLVILTGRDYEQIEKAIIAYSKTSQLSHLQVAERLHYEASRGDDVTWILPRAQRKPPHQEPTP